MSGLRIPIRTNWLGIILLAGVVVSACGGGQAPQSELTHIRLPMGFVPNIQYAPFYVADARGYFAEAGLEIEFDYSPETDGVALVGSGSLPLALASGEQVLLARAQGAPVVYVFAWWQDFPVAVVAPQELELMDPADLEGLKIGIPGRFGASYIGLRALLNAGGISEDDLQLESIGFNQVEALATDQVQAAVVYVNNEPIQLRAQGFDVDVLRVSDYVQLASNGVITNEEMLLERPQIVRQFISAVRHGLMATLDDPEAAFQISLDYVDGLDQANQQVQMQVLETSMAFWQAETLGRSDPAAWENMQRVLLDMQLLEGELALEAAYSNEYLAETE